MVEVMPVIVSFWRRCGGLFKRRPVAVISTFVGLLIAATFVIGVMTYQHEQEIKTLQTSFCQDNLTRCETLLDNLLNDPTPSQRAKIRAIVEGK